MKVNDISIALYIYLYIYIERDLQFNLKTNIVLYYSQILRLYLVILSYKRSPSAHTATY